MPDKFKELGMNRRIARRDFLNGVAVGVAAAPYAFAAEADQEFYSPLQSHLRGNIPSAIAEFDQFARENTRSFLSPLLKSTKNTISSSWEAASPAWPPLISIARPGGRTANPHS